MNWLDMGDQHLKRHVATLQSDMERGKNTKGMGRKYYCSNIQKRGYPKHFHFHIQLH
jgi:hypothetical protein